jgi:hypothetical protein
VRGVTDRAGGGFGVGRWPLPGTPVHGCMPGASGEDGLLRQRVEGSRMSSLPATSRPRTRRR